MRRQAPKASITLTVADADSHNSKPPAVHTGPECPDVLFEAHRARLLLHTCACSCAHALIVQLAKHSHCRSHCHTISHMLHPVTTVTTMCDTHRERVIAQPTGSKHATLLQYALPAQQRLLPAAAPPFTPRADDDIPSIPGTWHRAEHIDTAYEIPAHTGSKNVREAMLTSYHNSNQSQCLLPTLVAAMPACAWQA